MRPLLEREVAGGEEAAVECLGGEGRKVRVKSQKVKKGEDAKRIERARDFEFDACLGPGASQQEVFAACELDELVGAALDGYAVTVFAFGQTGSGKTHSIVGPDFGHVKQSLDAVPEGLREQDGIMQKAAARAFELMAARDGGCEASMTSLELYNEQVTDLIVPGSAPLEVRNHPQRGFFVQGLREVASPDLPAFLKSMYTSLNRRRMGSHNLNQASTRSHSMVTLNLSARPRAGGGGLSTYGRICFVDLAGSERLKATGSGGKAAMATQQETGSINRSLFTLGKVISALSDRGGRREKAQFVPFRDSKLTQLLIDSLQGRGRAVMLACCSPLQDHAEETLNTLRFANLALHVFSEPVVILDPQDQLIVDLRKEIQSLRSENRKMAGQLSSIESQMTLMSRPGTGAGPPPAAAAGPPEGTGRPAVAPPRTRSPQAENTPKEARQKPAAPPRKPPTASERSAQRAYGGGPAAVLQPAPGKLNAQSPYHFGGPDSPPASPPRREPAARWAPRAAHPGPLAGRKPGRKKEAPRPAAAPKEEFPELAALEAAFQSQLAAARGEVAPGKAADGPGGGVGGFDGGAGGFGGGAAAAAEEEEPAHEPEEKAIQWARNNSWFGTDMVMTEFAYEVHDQLVEVEGVDPSSDEYYDQIELRVAMQFPGKLAHLAPRPGRAGAGRLPKYAAAGAYPGAGRLSQSLKAPVPKFRAGKEWVSGGSGPPPVFDTQSYLDQRQQIVEELRQAKEEAELERKRILSMISKSVGTARF